MIQVAIASVAHPSAETAIEIPPSGIFCVSLAAQAGEVTMVPHTTPLTPPVHLGRSPEEWDGMFAEVLGRAVAVRVADETVPWFDFGFRVFEIFSK